jgi:hypothetical protein
MLCGRRISQGLTLCQAAPAWEATLVIRGLTQDQALQNPAVRVTSVKMTKQSSNAAALEKKGTFPVSFFLFFIQPAH